MNNRFVCFCFVFWSSVSCADVAVNKGNLNVMIEAIRGMNEADSPKKVNPEEKPSDVVKPEVVDTHSPVKEGSVDVPIQEEQPREELTQEELIQEQPAEEEPAMTPEEIRRQHEKIMGESPSLRDELERKHREIMNDSLSSKDANDEPMPHQTIIEKPRELPQPAHDPAH